MRQLSIICALFTEIVKIMSKPFVAILMGSDSDLPVMEASFDILKKFDIPFEVKVTSAHRTQQPLTAMLLTLISAVVRLLSARQVWRLI